MKFKRLLSTIFIVSMVLMCVVPFEICNVHALNAEVYLEEPVYIETIDPIGDIEKRIENDRIERVKKEIERARKKREEQERLAKMTIEEKIELSCKKYKVPYRTVLAIARLETGWFSSVAYRYRNNPGGLSVNEKPISFDTIEDGVDAFVKNLAENYFYIGLETPSEIGEKYCPVNPEWASMVRELMMYEC